MLSWMTKLSVSLLLSVCTLSCYRAAPPLEEDEVPSTISENPEIVSTPEPKPSPSPTKTSTVSVFQTAVSTRPNNMPLIMQIGNQTANEYTQMETIGFRVFDFDDDVRCQDILPSSSDHDVIKVTTEHTTVGTTRSYGDVAITGGTSTSCGIAIKTYFARANPVTIGLSLKDPSDPTLIAKSNFTVQVNSTNTAPYISTSGDSSYVVNEDQPSAAEFQLPTFSDDTQRAGHALKYEVISSPTLGTIVWPAGFPNSTGKLRYSPKENLHGSDTLSYKVCDNDPGMINCSAIQTISVTVNPVNDNPTIEPINPQTAPEGDELTVTFKVDDKDGNLECKSPFLNYTVNVLGGDVSGLVNDQNALTWSGDWPYCVGKIKTNDHKTGTVHITFLLSDGSGTASRQFKLTSTDKNYSPTITSTLTNQTIDEDTSVDITVGVEDQDCTDPNCDAVTKARYICSSLLSYSSSNSILLPGSGAVTFSGTWPNCSARITPAVNKNGSTAVSFTVKDPDPPYNTSSKNFTLNVSAKNDTPKGNVTCTANAGSDTVRVGRSGSWSVTCSGATDDDNDALTYVFEVDNASPFNNSAGFTCPTPTFSSNANSASFSTTSYGTCKYRVKACDPSQTCTALSTNFVEITSYQLDSLSLATPTLASDCTLTATAGFSPSGNIASTSYKGLLGLCGISEISGVKSISQQNETVSFSGTVPDTCLVDTVVPIARNKATQPQNATFTISTGTFKSTSKIADSSDTINTITHSGTKSYTVSRSLAALATKPIDSFTLQGVSVDGLQPEYATTSGTCRKCNSSTFASLSAGANHSCLIDGSMSKCWGRNLGQLGLPNSQSASNYTFPQTTSTSTASSSQSGFTPVQISAGKDFTCALSSSTNAIRCSGSNIYGQLGVASTTTAFTTNVNLPSNHTPIAVVASKTGTHACAILNDTSFNVNGKLYCWGLNSSGQLGLGHNNSSGAAGTIHKVTTGEFSAQNEKIISVAVGKQHTCAVQYQSASQTSQVYCWGSNSQGQLGTGNTSNALAPLSLGMNVNVVQVVAGDSHSCALTSLGDVYCWGSNEVGQLGLGHVNQTLSPTRISTTNDAPPNTFEKVVQLSAGANHTCALTENYFLYCWGLGTSGQLGVGKSNTEDQTAGEDCNTNEGITAITFCKQKPSKISTINTPVTLSAGMNHTCILTVEGYVYCWGENTDGRLGTANTALSVGPRPVCNSSNDCTTTGMFGLSFPRARMCSYFSIP